MDAQNGIEDLILARDALTAFNVRYFLMDGTLLGLVRDGCFIDSEKEDIDIGVLAEDFTVLSFGLYTSLMRRKGFTGSITGVWGKYLVVHWERKKIQVDLWFYFRRGDQRITYGFDEDIIEFSYPAWQLETFAPVDFYGKTFMAPKHKEAVLAHQYGDWKIRRADWDWRTSPLNIAARRPHIPKWKTLPLPLKLKTLPSRLSNRILRGIWSAMGAIRILVT